jgi:hypothetical protein
VPPHGQAPIADLWSFSASLDGAGRRRSVYDFVGQMPQIRREIANVLELPILATLNRIETYASRVL